MTLAVVDSHRGGVPGTLRIAMSGASWALGRGSRLGLLQTFAGLGGRLFTKKGLIGPMPAPLNRWTNARDLPPPPRESFRRWWKRTDGGLSETGSHPATAGQEGGKK